MAAIIYTLDDLYLDGAIILTKLDLEGTVVWYILLSPKAGGKFEFLTVWLLTSTTNLGNASIKFLASIISVKDLVAPTLISLRTSSYESKAIILTLPDLARALYYLADMF